ncbi:hypothetical protein BDR06DRAFT_172578 [Suillus hirtellus]|nr:hypothetical protein BDR06DRAFT_172578 [Suillus hirtellus]
MRCLGHTMILYAPGLVRYMYMTWQSLRPWSLVHSKSDIKVYTPSISMRPALARCTCRLATCEILWISPNKFFYRFQPTLHVNGHYNSTETKWICQFLEHSAVLDFISTQEVHSIFGESLLLKFSQGAVCGNLCVACCNCIIERAWFCDS